MPDPVPPDETVPLSVPAEVPAVSPTDPPASLPQALISGETAEATAEFTPWAPEAIAPLLPEGYEVTPDQSAALLEAVNEAKGDPAATVKNLLTLYRAEADKAEATAAEAFSTLQTKMQDEIRNDPTFGGAKLEQSLATANELVGRFGSPEFAELLSATGAGNSIHMLRFLHKVKEAIITEGTPVGGSPTVPPKTLGDKLFPKV